MQKVYEDYGILNPWFVTRVIKCVCQWRLGCISNVLPMEKTRYEDLIHRNTLDIRYIPFFSRTSLSAWNISLTKRKRYKNLILLKCPWHKIGFILFYFYFFCVWNKSWFVKCFINEKEKYEDLIRWHVLNTR